MKIVLSGSLAIDRIMVFDGLFEDLIQADKLRVLSISPLVNKLRITRGGIAGNIAYSLALLGEHPTLYASIGQDGKDYIQQLLNLGVDTSFVHFSELPTASFSVLTDNNDCQVGGFYPGAMSDAESLTLTQFADEDIFMVVSAHDPAMMFQQITECKRLGKRLFFDVGQQALTLSAEALRTGIETAELLIVNDYEMGLLIKKTGWSEEHIARQMKVCVVTLGEQGSRVSIDNGRRQLDIPAVKVNSFVDPTGAGDAFRAGFLYGYVRNWSVNKSAQLGSTVASFVIEKLGTQEHWFNKDDINNRNLLSYGMKVDWR